MYIVENELSCIEIVSIKTCGRQEWVLRVTTADGYFRDLFGNIINTINYIGNKLIISCRDCSEYRLTIKSEKVEENVKDILNILDKKMIRVIRSH